MLAGCGGADAAAARPRASAGTIPTARAQATATPQEAITATTSAAGKSVEVRIEGLSGLSLEDAKEQMCLADRRCAAQRPFDPDLVERDGIVLQGNLYDHGYVAARLETTRVEDTPQGKIVTFRVLEGPRFKVTSIQVTETPTPPRNATKLRIPAALTKAGEWFSRRTLAADRDRIQRVFRDAGYAKVDVIPQVEMNPDAPDISVRIVITRGGPITIARIRTPNGPSAEVLERCTKLGLLPGSLFNESKLEALKRGLEARNPDVAVAILDIEGHPDQVEVSVELP